MILFPCDTFQSLGREKGGARSAAGVGRGLAVNLHSVIFSPPGSGLRAEGGKRRGEMNVFRRLPGGSWHPPESCLRTVPDQEDPRSLSLKSSPHEGMCSISVTAGMWPTGTGPSPSFFFFSSKCGDFCPGLDAC